MKYRMNWSALEWWDETTKTWNNVQCQNGRNAPGEVVCGCFCSAFEVYEKPIVCDGIVSGKTIMVVNISCGSGRTINLEEKDGKIS